jgi:ATP-dependent DNA helicase RecQ
VLYGDSRIAALKKEDETRKQSARAREFGHYDENLFEQLRRVRKNIAEENQVPPFVIFSDKTFTRCADTIPSLPYMRRISGVGDAKLERYGGYFIQEIEKPA